MSVVVLMNSTARRNGALGAARQVHIASLFPDATYAIVPHLYIVLSCVCAQPSFSFLEVQAAGCLLAPHLSGRCTAVIEHCIYITSILARRTSEVAPLQDSELLRCWAASRVPVGETREIQREPLANSWVATLQ